MKINFKNKMYIYHPDGKFTEAQLCELLEAARKMGYDEGYEAAKAYYNKPNWWYWTNTTTPAVINTPYITCTSDSDNSNLTSTTTTATTINNSDDFIKSYTYECKINPKESQEAIDKLLGNNINNEELNKTINIKKPKTLEFRYYGTER